MRLKNFNLLLGSQIFKACADESRLRILNLIFSNGEMCITDLEQILEFTQAKTSRHLIYLKNAGPSFGELGQVKKHNNPSEQNLID